MADTISYQYAALSALQRAADQDELCLAKYSEIEKKDAPCFFWGKLTQPYMTARCLIALSNVVQSSFNLTPAQLSILKDPIVTATKVMEIAEMKMPDLNAANVEAAYSMICGTARSMGIVVEE